MLNKTRDPRNWKKCVRHTKGGNSTASHKAREKLAKVKSTLFGFCYSRCRKEFSYFVCLQLKVSVRFSRVYHLRSRIFNTSCWELRWTFHSRTHTPRWDDCEGALHLRGPLRLVLIYLAWPSPPLLQGARGSSPRSSEGPWHDNILRNINLKEDGMWIKASISCKLFMSS